MTDQTKVSLTPDQIKARQAALDAANATATPSNTTPSPANGPTVEVKPAATPEAPLTDKTVSQLLTAATTALGNGTAAQADKAVAALATAAKPVDDHKAAIAKANANTGKPAQGGTITGNRGAPKSQRDKNLANKVDVSAAKVKAPKSNRDAAMANPAYVAGFDLGRWPKSFAGVDNPAQYCPTEVDIMVARAFNVAGTTTMNELNLAAELGRNVFTVKREKGTVTVQANVSVYTLGDLCGPVKGMQGDHKMNIVSAAVRKGYAGFVKPDGTLLTGSTVRAAETGLNKPNGKVCYGIKLTPLGIKAAETSLGAGKVPAYMLPPGVAYTKGTTGGWVMVTSGPSKATGMSKPNQATTPA